MCFVCIFQGLYLSRLNIRIVIESMTVDILSVKVKND